MRGLPPPPAGVAQLRLGFDIDDTWATIAFWIAVPQLDLLSVAELESLAGAFIFSSIDFTAPITHHGCNLTRVDLRRWGPRPLALVRSPGPSPGSWTGGQVATACSIVHWLLSEGGRGNDGLTHVPGFPDVFTDDHTTLNQLGWGNVRTAADRFLNAINTTAAPLGGTCLLGTLHRSSGGTPLAAATFSPIVGAVPSNLIGTLDRRRGRSGRISPS